VKNINAKLDITVKAEIIYDLHRRNKLLIKKIKQFFATKFTYI
jgi:hypothetical protein